MVLPYSLGGMTNLTICPKCQTDVHVDIAGFCSSCGSGILPIVLAGSAVIDSNQGDQAGPDFVILQNSVWPKTIITNPNDDRPHQPPSSTSTTETLLLAPNERQDSSAIRLGSLAIAANSPQLPSGISSTNKFTLVEELGRGGMGIIIRGRDKVLHRDVALKVIRDPSDELQRERFIKEAQVTGQLEHPNIVPVHEFGIDQNGRIFFAMKLVRGRTLAEIIHGHRKNDASTMAEYPLTRLVAILIQVCHAVAFAHSRGVIHRDLKPSNIMLGDFGEVMLMDWGLAKVGVVDVPDPAGLDDPTPTTANRPTVHKLDETHDGAVLGTPVYMPPEQAMGQISSMDARSDVYALGAILYEMLTLRTPVEGEEIKDVLHKVIFGHIFAPEALTPQRAIPRDLSAVAMKSLSLRPENRYPDVISMRRDLERFLDGRVVSARDDNLFEVLVRFGRRHRVASFVVGSVMCVLIAVVSFGYVANLAQRRVAEAERQRAEVMRSTAEQERTKAQISGINAEQERQRAMSAQRQAEEQGRLADEARAKTTIALESESRLRQRSEQTAHFVSLSLANEQITRRDFDAARASLDACPVRLRDWSWRHLALVCHQHLAQWNDHVGSVKQLAHGMNGRLLVSSGEDGSLVMIDLLTRLHVFEMNRPANAVAMAGEKPLLVVADAQHVYFINALDGHQLGVIPVPAVGCLAIAADGSRVIIGTASGAWWSCNPTTAEHHVIGQFSSPVSSLTISPDGGLIAGDAGGQLIALDAQERLVWQRRLPGRIMALAPQGMAVVREPQRVCVYDAVSGLLLAQVPQHPNALNIVAGCFSPDGKRFALASEDRTAQVFDSLTAAPVVTLEGHAKAVLALLFINGSERLATGSADGSVRLWNAQQAGAVRQLCSPGTETVIHLTADGKTGLLAGSNGVVRSFAASEQTAASEHIKNWKISIGFAVLAGYSPPRSSVIALGGEHGQVRLIHAQTGDIIGAHGFGVGVLQSLITDDDLGRILATDGDGLLHSLDRVNGRRFSLSAVPPGFSALAFTVDQQQVVVGGVGGKIAWFSCENGASTRSETTKLQAIHALRWSPDGTRLAIAGDDLILLWNPTTREMVATLRGHSGTVSDVSFSSDGSRLLSASHDGTVRIWDVASARTLLVLDAHSGSLRTARMTSDGREIITSANDGRVLMWRALEQQSWD